MTRKQAARIEKLLRFQAVQLQQLMSEVAIVGLAVLEGQKRPDLKAVFKQAKERITARNKMLSKVLTMHTEEERAEDLAIADEEKAATQDAEKFERDQEKAAAQDAELIELLKKTSIPE